MSYNIKRFIAFTLAEVLITLGIIGIVAAMTIPTLMNNSQNSEFHAAWKKEYSVASQIVSTMTANNEMPYGSPNEFVNGFANSLSYIKQCANSATEGCWHADGQWYTLHGDTMTGGFYGTVNEPGFVLKDGSYLVLVLVNSHYACNPPSLPAYIFALNPYIVFGYVDVNGAKKPNKLGIDIFGFHVFGNRILPSGADGTGFEATDFCDRTRAGNVNIFGIGCSNYSLMGKSY